MKLVIIIVVVLVLVAGGGAATWFFVLNDPNKTAEAEPEPVVEEVRTGSGNMVVVVSADGATEVIPVAD